MTKEILPPKCQQALSVALKALCLTQDYIGKERLPPIKGWEWFDACKTISLLIPKDEWVAEFAMRTISCPQCESDTGLKYPRALRVHCEDCGWPDEYFEAEASNEED